MFPLPVAEVLGVLSGANLAPLLVGGAVRDLLLGIEPRDWDISIGRDKLKTAQALLRRARRFADLSARRACMIGDPELRFAEDPARIVRLARIAGKLGLSVDEQTRAAARNELGAAVKAQNET